MLFCFPPFSLASIGKHEKLPWWPFPPVGRSLQTHRQSFSPHKSIQSKRGGTEDIDFPISPPPSGGGRSRTSHQPPHNSQRLQRFGLFGRNPDCSRCWSPFFGYFLSLFVDIRSINNTTFRFVTHASTPEVNSEKGWLHGLAGWPAKSEPE